MSRFNLIVLNVIVLAICCCGSSRYEPHTVVFCGSKLTAPSLPKCHAWQTQQPTTVLDRADALFDQQKWAEARSSYDQLFSSKVDIQRHIAERTIICSLMVFDWNDARSRALSFQMSREFSKSVRRYWPTNLIELGGLERYIKHLEFSRHLLQTILQKSQTEGPKPLQDQLISEIIAINFTLLKTLDPDSVTEPQKSGWAYGYTGMQWWWEELQSDADDFGRDDRSYYRNWRVGIPIDRDGKRVSWSISAEYPVNVGRVGKILYLLDEIERLDSSETKNAFAQALLHRADLMRRIYGPNSDPAWERAVFNYQYVEQPSFNRGRNDAGLKQFWELDDDEARAIVGSNIQVFTLSASESPLAIWRRIEESFSNSGRVAEAIYQRGLYYQNRQQFSKAIGEYERLSKQFPTDNRATVAQTQIKNIHHADVLLGSTGVYPAGSSPSLWFACRNTESVEFTVRQFDLKRYLLNRERVGDLSELTYFGSFERWQADKDLKEFVGEKSAQWSQTIPLFDRVSTHSTEFPVTKAGAYIIEAHVPGTTQSSYGLVILTGAAIIQKSIANGVLLWAVDSRTGQPLPNEKIQTVSEKNRHQWSTLTTDEDGAIYLQPTDDEDSFALLVTRRGDISFCRLNSDGNSQFEEPEISYAATTDRPLYRPGATVNFRIWIRELTQRKFRPSVAGAKINVKILGPSNGTIRKLSLLTDDTGSVSGNLQLGNDAPLGMYSVSIEDPIVDWEPEICSFRVDEYKKPEFQVSVLPSRKTARLGESITAVVQADYYTGRPVAGAAVRYQIDRRNHVASYQMPTDWDWLYGEGFGNYSYLYPWLGDSMMTTEDDRTWSFDSLYFGASPDELVSQGTAQLNEQGIAEIRFDTARFAQDLDHEFTITVEVRDESRRTIKGSGSVLATRQQFFAFTRFDRGWYETGSESNVEIDMRSANDQAVSAEGKVSLYRINTVNKLDSPQDFEKELVAAWPVKTDADGHAKLSFKTPHEGQYRLEFSAHDDWQHPVTSASTIWVHGPKFDGNKYKFGDLEIIPDKSTYRVGESAKLLINTAQANSRLLIVDSMKNLRFIDIANHSTVVEIPLTARHVPNFFFEATLVHAGQVFSESCEIYVPPIDDLLTIELRPDRQNYQPGEKGSVQVNVTDANGKPVSGSIALTAYDKSLTYIQQEFGQSPKSLLMKRRTEYWLSGIEHTLQQRKFHTSGTFVCPEFHLEDGSRPMMGGMGGAAASGGDPADTNEVGSNRSRRAAGKESSNTDSVFAPQFIESKIRTDFSDTAVWLPNLQLNDQGSAVADITFPESLTTWRMRGYLVTPETKVGEAICEVSTTKDLIVRLQTPRFLVESDEVVLSANVQNFLSVEKDVSAELILPAKLFKSLGENTAQSLTPDDQGNLHLVQRAKVQSGKAQRFDWPLNVQTTGLATIVVKAQTDLESDAMQLTVPVNSRGIMETESQSGFFRTAETGSKEIKFELPASVDSSKTKIELTMIPSAAGAAFDALPFLADYPYGCVEQTMSRFYPTVLAVDTLKKLGTNLEDIASKIPERNRRDAGHSARSFVFDSAELQRMSNAGLERLYRFQHGDGGWGWWEHDDSSPYMTAYVLLGLNTAAESEINVSESVISNGVLYLIESLNSSRRERDESMSRANERAFIVYVLSLKRSIKEIVVRRKIQELINSVDVDRAKLNSYGKALLALAFHNQKMTDQANEVLTDILDDLENDKQRNTSWIPTPKQDWWLWDNNDIETNAWVLRALLAIDADMELASRIVNWLVEQRLNGTYWRSTRDSALAVHALAEYLLIVQQATGNYSVAVSLDGKHVKDVQVNWQKMLGMETRVLLTGDTVKPGKHQITLVKNDQGPLHFSLTNEYFTKHDRILAKGTGGLHIERRYFVYPAKSDGTTDQPKSAEPVDRLGTPLKFGDTLAVGDTIDVELTISSDENYAYLAFEDPKLAGCEPIQLRSGYEWDDGLCSNIELRDSKVIFFVSQLPRGKHVLSYQLRAEVCGKFTAMPSQGFAMNTPEISARSDEMQLLIKD